MDNTENQEISKKTINRFSKFGKIIKETEDTVYVEHPRTGKVYTFNKKDKRHGKVSINEPDDDGTDRGWFWELVGAFLISDL